MNPKTKELIHLGLITDLYSELFAVNLNVFYDIKDQIRQCFFKKKSRENLKARSFSIFLFSCGA